MDPTSDLEQIRALLEQGDRRDRAYVDALVRIAWVRAKEPAQRLALVELHRRLAAGALDDHASVRRSIAAGELRGAALRAFFEAVPGPERDPFVEEVLGIAYPPLDELELAPELIGYCPAGYDEIVHALDVTRIGRGDRLFDIGSGAGKVVMLAALLTGASCAGLECNPALVELARGACNDLRIEGVRLRIGDARDEELDDADVTFMYLPFGGGAQGRVMTRLLDSAARIAPAAAGGGGRYLCAGALDLARYPELAPAAEPRSWLHVYAWRPDASRLSCADGA